jgi:hypothetical protein
MFRQRVFSALIVLSIVFLLGGYAAAAGRTVGQVIDDTAIAAQVKAKLVADKPSNLTHVSVKSMESVVTLSGEVDSAAVRDRAVQIAAGVGGVKSVVDNIVVTGAGAASVSPPPPPAGPSTSSSSTTWPASSPAPSAIDVNGIVARVDPQAGTITLQDGRVIKMADRTVIWQPVPLGALQPGTQISVRNAEPLAFQPATPGTTANGGWRMGTVSRIDQANGIITLSDGATVRVGPTTKINVRGEQVPISRLQPGTEIVIRRGPQTASIDASDVDVVWTAPR